MWEDKGREVSTKRSPVPALAACGAHGAGPEPDSPGSSVSARSPFSTLSSLPVAGAVWSGVGREEEPGTVPQPCAEAPTVAPARGFARSAAAPPTQGTLPAGRGSSPSGIAGAGKNRPRLREAGMCFRREFRAVPVRPSNSHR